MHTLVTVPKEPAKATLNDFRNFKSLKKIEKNRLIIKHKKSPPNGKSNNILDL